MSENLEQPLDENPASQRHWLYGFNAFVLVVVGLVVLGFLLRICETDAVKNHTKFDWSSNGANSLSGGTQKMLQIINSKPEKYTVWSLFTDATDQQKRDQPDQAAEQSRRRQQVNDLLRQYTRASANILVEDRGDASRDDIEKQIRDKYQADFKPYQDAVNDYDPLVKKLSDFLKTEAAAIGAYGQKPGTPPDEAEAAAVIQAQFAGAPDELSQDQRLIHRETDSILPDWGMLTTRIADTINQIEPLFAVLSDPTKLKEAGFPPTLASYFTGVSDKYKALETDLKTYKDRLAKLEPLKVQDVLSSLTRNAVVIMGEKSAKVVSQFDIYSDAAPNGGAAAGLAFNGEQAISSALYAMAKPDKVKVVFVTPSPQHLLDDTYSDFASVLKDNNFDVLEWSPTSAAPQGQPPEPSGPPPALGKGVVWIVFTPDAPNMQMMMMGGGMPNPQPVIDATQDHMAKGGQVLFMADAGAGMMGPANFAYADLIKDFGIEVQSKYTVVQLQVNTDQNTGRQTNATIPFVGLPPQPLVFAKNEITTPVDGLPTVFGPMMTQQGQIGAATVVKVLSPLPTGVWAQEIVKTPYSTDYWGESEPSATATYDKDKDYPPPVPLMAVAVKDKDKKAADGSPDEKRVAVVGAKMIGSNFFLDLTETQVVGDVGYRIQRFPGNSEILKNTVLWLAGYENMIAVSAKSNAASRIGGVSAGQMIFIRFLVLLIVPLAALVIGGIVWAARHR